MPKHELALEIADLSFQFGNKAALDDVRFSVGMGHQCFARSRWCRQNNPLFDLIAESQARIEDSNLDTRIPC